MYQTKHGPFNGDLWEQTMQICFRLKYEIEHYQPIPASSGDCGIEGFTRTGKVFQCYCPDNNLKSVDLYINQRDKVTADLRKLKLFKDKLSRFLNGVKIGQWIFVTPEFRMNDLVLHCNKKKDEVLSWNLPFIDPDFVVVVHDIDHFVQQIPIALSGGDQKLMIGPEAVSSNIITQWKDQQIDLVENALRKHTKRFPHPGPTVEEKVNKLTANTIKSYFDRESILKRWQNLHPQDFDKFLILISQIEAEVEEQCMFPADDNDELYRTFRKLVKNKLIENFPYLDDVTTTNLTHGVIADWLLRCPLDFE